MKLERVLASFCVAGSVALGSLAFGDAALAAADRVGFTLDGREVDARLVRFEGRLFLVTDRHRVIAEVEAAPVSVLTFDEGWERGKADVGRASVAETRQVQRDRLSALVDDLERERERVDPRRKFIGIGVEAPGPALATQLGIDRTTAIVVTSVSSSSPAARAGLRVHDVIVNVEGSGRGDLETLRRFIRGANVGSEIRISVVRAGRRVTLDVPVGLREARSSH